MSESGNANRGRTLRPLAALAPHFLRYRAMVGAALFFLLLATATTLTLPMAVRRMIDKGFSTRDAAFIDSYFGMLVVIAVVLALASAARYYFVITLGERVVADLRREIFDHLSRLSPAFFDAAQSGELVSRLTADTTQLKSAVGATASMALRNTLLGVGAAAMMIYTSPKLSAITLGAIPLIVLPLMAFGREVRRRSRTAQDTLAEATAYATEAIGAMRVVQAYANEGRAARRFADAVDFSFGAARAAVRTRAALTAFAIFLVFSSVVAVLWYGAAGVLSGAMSPGTLGQFMLYAVFAAGALAALSEVWGELAQAAGAAERISELLAEKPAIAAPANPVALSAPVRGEISFASVRFAYPARPQTAALENLSLTVKPGETVAIVGPSGAGKSTLFSLLLRFYDPTAGSIRLDGVDLRDVDPQALRRSIALVPQDTLIFAASAMENIRFGRPEASEGEAIEAAKMAHADEFVVRLPQGYATPLGERGVTLSGGQRQRIAIARAILKNAPVLLLDEATSALDAESERYVQEALARLMQGRTTLVIAHRLATVLKAGRILVLDGGRIVEEGTHKSLSARGGVYARLAALQFDAAAIREPAD